MSVGGDPVADGGRVFPGGVRLTVAGRVATVLLDRPEIKNAQTFATWASLTELGTSVLPGQVDVVLIRGAGSDFSAGLDLRQLRDGGVPGEGEFAELRCLDLDGRAAKITEFQRAFSCWRELDAVVIAVVQGRAIGAGFQLALAADLRVATSEATFTMAEPRLGLVPDLGGSHRLTELVGYSRALRICAGAQPVPAGRALDWGLIDDVLDEFVDDDHLATGVQDLVDALTAHRPGLTGRLKQLVRAATTNSYGDQLELERRTQASLLDGLPE